MRRIAAGLVFSAAAAVAATMTGWISDSNCGAGNASAAKESRECAERCIKSGAAPVFVTENDGKVYRIAGDVKALDHIQHKVQIIGDVKGDTITVKEIKKQD
jgi:hypothetical protein